MVWGRLGLAKCRLSFWELRHAVGGELTTEQAAALQQVEAEVKAAGWKVAELTSLQSALKQLRASDAHSSEEELQFTTPEQLKQYADEALTDLQLRMDTKGLVDLVQQLDPGKAPLMY